MNSRELQRILERVAAGELSVADSERLIGAGISNSAITASSLTSGEGLSLDLERHQRCGYPEVVYAPGKSFQTLNDAVRLLIQAGQPVLVTRCSLEQSQFLQQEFSELLVDLTSRTARSPSDRATRGKVVVISAGSSDLPVALEAVETLKWMDVETDLMVDVGVAGPQRFLREKHRLEGSQAIVVVAGMEGALPSVVGGWVSCPVFAVPTSVGYGSALGGMTPLLGMLNSCAANVAVVNIDAGFKAGYLAGMVARSIAQGINPK